MTVVDHRCEPGAKVLDTECTWHGGHYWCSWCEGFYGIPHEVPAKRGDRSGCHSQPGPWTGGPPAFIGSGGCACRFCVTHGTAGFHVADAWRLGQIEKHTTGTAVEAPPQRIAPFPNLSPSPSLTDRQWEQVIKLLRGRGTGGGDRLADKIEKQVQETRRQAAIRGHRFAKRRRADT